MLPVAAWFGLTRRSQEGALKPWTSLVGDAAASALSVHRPEAVLEVLEQGRAVLLSAQLERSTALATLASVAPDVASRLDAIRAQLHRSGDNEPYDVAD